MKDVEKEAERSLEKRNGEYWCGKTDNVYTPYTEGFKDGADYGWGRGVKYTHLWYKKKLEESQLDKESLLSMLNASEMCMNDLTADQKLAEATIEDQKKENAELLRRLETKDKIIKKLLEYNYFYYGTIKALDKSLGRNMKAQSVKEMMNKTLQNMYEFGNLTREEYEKEVWK